MNAKEFDPSTPSNEPRKPLDFQAYQKRISMDDFNWSESGDPLQLRFPDQVANTPEEIEELSRKYDVYVTLKTGRSEAVVWANPDPRGSLDTLYDPNI